MDRVEDGFDVKMREEESRGGLEPLSSSGKGQWFQISLHWNVSVSPVTY